MGSLGASVSISDYVGASRMSLKDKSVVVMVGALGWN